MSLSHPLRGKVLILVVVYTPAKYNHFNQAHLAVSLVHA